MRFETTSTGLRVFAPAKINLYLEVGPRRADGFHDIDSLFVAVGLYDEIELTPLPAPAIEIDESGIADGERNLVWSAADLFLKSSFAPPDVGVRLSLHKRIPVGAGLGGGSSDAAATLLGLCRLWGRDVSAAELLPLAEQLGSDVPFFLAGGVARCRGRGEEVVSWPKERLSKLHFVLVYPGVSVSTKEAYGNLDRSRDPNFTLTGTSALDTIPRECTYRLLAKEDVLFNRFEAVVYALLPPLQQLYNRLHKESFAKVLLSGSGSTIFGLCESGEEACRLSEKLSAELPEAEVFAVESLDAWGELPDIESPAQR